MSFNDKNGRTRWKSAKMAVEALIPAIFQYDADGSVPLYLFGSDVDFVGECTKPEQIAEVFDKFQPGGTTNLSACLEEAMETYLGKKRANYEVIHSLRSEGPDRCTMERNTSYSLFFN